MKNDMEITLFDILGRPVAYIANDTECSIYTWNGYAVCYIYNGKIYGWKGHHIGWFVDGIVYDTNGFRFGYTKQKCPKLTQLERIKSIKHIKNIKGIRCIPYIRPMFKVSESSKSLYDFLTQDY